MEPRKYSTGTKGRIKKHSDECKAFVHAHTPNFSLATEFIASIDPEYDESIWQRYQTPADLLLALQEWLGEEKAPEPKTKLAPFPRRAPIQPASLLAADAALEKTRAWIADSAGHLAALSPTEVAEATAVEFHRLLTRSGE